jgi:ribonuclease HI
MNVYYTATDSGYGLVIEQQNVDGTVDFKYGKTGLCLNREIGLLNALEGAAEFFDKINRRGELSKDKAIEIKFYSPAFDSLKYVMKANMNPANIKGSKEIVSVLKSLQAKMKSVNKKIVSIYNKIEVDDPGYEKEMFIKLLLEGNRFNDITGFYHNTAGQESNFTIVKKPSGTIIDGHIEINKQKMLQERKLVKKERELASIERKQSPEYQDMITLMLDNELSAGKIKNIDNITSKNSYDLTSVKNIEIYTDGSLKKQDEASDEKIYNHGYGVVILDSDTQEKLFTFKGRLSESMREMEHIEMVELYAIYRAANFIDKKVQEGVLGQYISMAVKTDNQDNIAKFDLFNSGETVRYQSLFSALKEATQRYDFKIDWVKGHSSNIHNREADKLAKGGLEMIRNEEQMVHESISQFNELMGLTEHLVQDKKPVMRRV